MAPRLSCSRVTAAEGRAGPTTLFKAVQGSDGFRVA